MAALGDRRRKLDLLTHLALAVDHILDGQGRDFAHAQACKIGQHQRHPVARTMSGFLYGGQYALQCGLRQHPEPASS